MDTRDTQVIFLSGPMAGQPDLGAHVFNTVERYLRDVLGYRHVENPSWPDDDHDNQMTWDWYQRRAIGQLIRCNAILMLPGWKESKGALLAHTIAHHLTMTVVEWNEATFDMVMQGGWME